MIEPQPHTEELVVEHQGFGWIDVISHGVAAHGSAPESGVDAIVHLAEVITRMHKLDQDVFTARPSLMNGRTVFHTGTISGGTDYATYPSQAKLGIEIGTQPGEHLSDRVAEIEAIFAEIARTERGFSGEIVVRLDRDPFVAEGHEELQAIVARGDDERARQAAQDHRHECLDRRGADAGGGNPDVADGLHWRQLPHAPASGYRSASSSSSARSLSSPS